MHCWWDCNALFCIHADYWLKRNLERQHDNKWSQNNRLRTWMGLYAEGDHKAEENSGRVTRTTIQFGRLYDALYVCFFYSVAWPMLSLFVSIPLFVRKALLFALFWFVINFDCRTIYNMCTQKPPHDYSQQLYEKYREAFEEYITVTVSIITIHVCSFLCQCSF